MPTFVFVVLSLVRSFDVFGGMFLCFTQFGCSFANAVVKEKAMTTVADPGEGPGGPGPPLFLDQNKGPKKTFFEAGPPFPLISGSG